jgi:UDP-2,3-diacylglucosamine hydrolase
MKKTFFIADVHLDPAVPTRRELILSFLTMVQREQGDLYIIGDFFDYWANNRAVLNNNLYLLHKMRDLSLQGCSIAMLIGNRDLLLNQRVLAPFGITFLGEEADIILEGNKVFLTHGYSLCTMDETFQRYKKRVWPIYRTLDILLPGFIENYLAKKFILKSKQVIDAQDQSRFQFSAEAKQAQFQRGVDTIICGHAHKQMHEAFNDKHFYALPSWDNRTGGYLLHCGGAFSLSGFGEK